MKPAISDTSMRDALEVLEYVSIPGKGPKAHLVKVDGNIGKIPHKAMLLALEYHDDLVRALDGMVKSRDRKPHSAAEATKAYMKAIAVLAKVRKTA